MVVSMALDASLNSANTPSCVNFLDMNIDIRATNTQRVAVDDLVSDVFNASTPDTDLDWRGIFLYDIDANNFTGGINTSAEGLNLSGETTFQFYGQDAEELGGVFSLSNSEINPTIFYSGAYGAVQVQPD